MHYQLFFPGESRGAKVALESCGLGDFLPGSGEAIVEVGDKRGLLIGWGSDIRLDPAITWQDVEGQPWRLGLWPDPPTPEDLSRGGFFVGSPVQMANGDRYLVPIAAELPQSMRLSGGKWTKQRKPAFEAFWRASEVWYRRWTVHSLVLREMALDANVSEDELLHEWCEFAVTALRQNYRICPEIASALGLFEVPETLMRIVMSVVDGMAIMEVLTEKERLDNSTVDGGQKKTGVE